MKTSLLTLAIVLLACAAGSGHGADAYKWKNGKVTTYSQLPPNAGVPNQRIHATSAAVRSTDSAGSADSTAGASGQAKAGDAKTKPDPTAKGELTPEQQKLKEQLTKDADTKLADLAHRRADQCTKAHGQFDELTQHARLRMQDAQGNWKILNDGERKQKLDEVQSRIVEFCS